MNPASTPRLWSRLTGRGRRRAGWMLADLRLLAAMAGPARAVSLAAGTLSAARIVMLTGVTEVHHG
jgi:phage terminase large subunit-like protein